MGTPKEALIYSASGMKCKEPGAQKARHIMRIGELSSTARRSNSPAQSINQCLPISNLIDQQGGLGGLVQKLQNGGLRDVAASWVGTGENLPVSAEALQQVLGNEQISQIAAKLGLSPDQAAGSLAQLLPQVVDKLTPNGSIEGGGLLEQGLDLLKGKLFG
jgi:uncharacterized protein YidB (DUF937 family)